MSTSRVYKYVNWTGLATLQLDGQLCERFHSEQVVQCRSSTRIVRPVQKLWDTHFRILECLRTINEILQPRRIQRANGFPEVAIRARVIEVECRRGVVGDHPWKYWVLRDVVVSSPRQRVDFHNVLECGHLAAFPCGRRCF